MTRDEMLAFRTKILDIGARRAGDVRALIHTLSVDEYEQLERAGCTTSTTLTETCLTRWRVHTVTPDCQCYPVTSRHDPPGSPHFSDFFDMLRTLPGLDDIGGVVSVNGTGEFGGAAKNPYRRRAVSRHLGALGDMRPWIIYGAAVAMGEVLDDMLRNEPYVKANKSVDRTLTVLRHSVLFSYLHDTSDLRRLRADLCVRNVHNRVMQELARPDIRHLARTIRFGHMFNREGVSRLVELLLSTDPMYSAALIEEMLPGHGRVLLEASIRALACTGRYVTVDSAP